MELKQKNISTLKKLLIITAMKMETESILHVLNGHVSYPINPQLGLVAQRYNKDGKEIYVVESGIGIANAAVVTSHALLKLKPEIILSVGVAGALSPILEIGDVIVGKDIIQHDSFYSGEDANELMAPGAPYLSSASEKRITPGFAIDPEYLNSFYSLIKNKSARVFCGGVISGSEFVGSYARKRELLDLFPGALVVDMEAAGIAQISREYNVPLIVIKTVADRLNPNGTIVMDYLAFSKAASRSAAAVVEQIIESWQEEFELRG